MFKWTFAIFSKLCSYGSIQTLAEGHILHWNIIDKNENLSETLCSRISIGTTTWFMFYYPNLYRKSTSENLLDWNHMTYSLEIWHRDTIWACSKYASGVSISPDSGITCSTQTYIHVQIRFKNLHYLDLGSMA